MTAMHTRWPRWVNRVERPRSEGFPVCPRKLHCRPRRVGDERRRDFRAPSRRSHTGDAGARSRGRRWVMHSRGENLFIAPFVRRAAGTRRERVARERRKKGIAPSTHYVPRSVLPQRLVVEYEPILHGVPGRGIRTSPFGKGALFIASAMNDPGKTVISLDAARLGIEPVGGLALPGELFPNGPWPRPHRGIFNRHLVFEGVRPSTCPALAEMQIFARALEIGLGTEVRHVDHERIALPMAARVAVPLADAGRQMRASIHDDVALPPLALTHVIEDRDTARRLHDPAEAPGRAAKFG